MQPANPEHSPPVGRKTKWKKVVVIVALILITIPLAGLTLIWIAFSGGIDREAKPAPDPNSSNIIAKRDAAKTSINQAFEALDASIGFTNYATSTHDRCYEGQNNWKVHDGYSHRCGYRVTRFYGFNGDFRQQMIDFEQKIDSIGWEHPDDGALTLRRIMEDYYDVYYGPDKAETRGFPGEYLVSNLPTPTIGYEKGAGVLEIEYAEKATKDLFQLEYAQALSRDTLAETYENKDFQDINAVFQEITNDNDFVLVIAIQKDYFQN